MPSRAPLPRRPYRDASGSPRATAGGSRTGRALEIVCWFIGVWALLRVGVGWFHRTVDGEVLLGIAITTTGALVLSRRRRVSERR
jgi:hypothetical protein